MPSPPIPIFNTVNFFTKLLAGTGQVRPVNSSLPGSFRFPRNWKMKQGGGGGGRRKEHYHACPRLVKASGLAPSFMEPPIALQARGVGSDLLPPNPRRNPLRHSSLYALATKSTPQLRVEPRKHRHCKCVRSCLGLAAFLSERCRAKCGAVLDAGVG